MEIVQLSAVPPWTRPRGDADSVDAWILPVPHPLDPNTRSTFGGGKGPGGDGGCQLLSRTSTAAAVYNYTIIKRKDMRRGHLLDDLHLERADPSAARVGFPRDR